MYNLVVFASGNGSTLQSIIDAINDKTLNSKIVLVVSNNPDAFALERAQKANIPIYIIKNKRRAHYRGANEYIAGIIPRVREDGFRRAENTQKTVEKKRAEQSYQKSGSYRREKRGRGCFIGIVFFSLAISSVCRKKKRHPLPFES